MRRRLATLAAMSALAFALGATPALAAGSPLTRVTGAATDMVEGGLLCGYTVTGGSITITYHTADVGIDPETGLPEVEAAHVTLQNVAAQRDDKAYKVVGVEIYNDLKGHLTMKIMFVGQGGGISDSLNVVLRYDRNGVLLVAHENDSCHMYG